MDGRTDTSLSQRPALAQRRAGNKKSQSAIQSAMYVYSSLLVVLSMTIYKSIMGSYIRK